MRRIVIASVLVVLGVIGAHAERLWVFSGQDTGQMPVRFGPIKFSIIADEAIAEQHGDFLSQAYSMTRFYADVSGTPFSTRLSNVQIRVVNSHAKAGDNFIVILSDNLDPQHPSNSLTALFPKPTSASDKAFLKSLADIDSYNIAFRNNDTGEVECAYPPFSRPGFCSCFYNWWRIFLPMFQFRRWPG